MKDVVTLDELLNLPKDILSITDKYNSLNCLLEETDYKNYDIIAIKQQLLELFAKFKSAKYLYRFPLEQNIELQSNTKMTEEIDYIAKNCMDKLLWSTTFYKKIKTTANKFTNKEAAYFINTFLIHQSEEDIAESLRISKTSLQKIKKSCLVKIWIDFKDYIEKINNIENELEKNMELNAKTIGAKIYEKRMTNGLTQEELAEKLYVTRQAISKWERGLSIPDYDSLINISKIFKINMNELFK